MLCAHSNPRCKLYMRAKSQQREWRSSAPETCLVNLLHLGGLVRGALDFLERRQVIVVAEPLVIIIDAQPKLDHAVNAASELGWLVQVEAAREQGGIEQQPNEVLDRLVRLVG